VRYRKAGLPALLALVGIVLVGSGLALTTAAPRAVSADIGMVASREAPPVSASTAPPPPPAATQTVAPGVAEPVSPPVPAAPVAMSLPHAPDVPVVPVGVLVSGALQLPDKPTVLGWYAAGAAPGADAGTAVMAGHLDSASLGPGPLVGLFDLDVGDLLQVADANGGIHRYSVLSRTSYPKTALPAEVFRRDGSPQLAVITCGGTFDTAQGHYADNVVVLAVPA
jgi:hypothetical protein